MSPLEAAIAADNSVKTGIDEHWELINNARLPLLWLEIEDASTLPGYSGRRIAAAGIGDFDHRPTILAPSFGAEWEKDGKSALASSPGFTEMMTFQKKLVDFYGYDALERFRAGLGQEYSADHAFHQGKIAIMMDGEYRTAFLKAQAPQIKFGTAPFPTWKPADYGTAFTTGTIMGIPKGAKNPGAAWELIKHLSFDTDTIVDLANPSPLGVGRGLRANLAAVIPSRTLWSNVTDRFIILRITI